MTLSPLSTSFLTSTPLSPAPLRPELAPRRRLHDRVPASLQVGPGSLTLPPGFTLGAGPLCPVVALGARGRGRTRLTSSGFWPVARLERPDLRALELAVVRGPTHAPRLRSVLVPRDLLRSPMALVRTLAAAGGPLVPRRHAFALARYLRAMVDGNELPVRPLEMRFGWDAARRSFQYGARSLGANGVLALSPGHALGRAQQSALVAAGEPAAWKDLAEQQLEASPAAGVVLAAAVASPMLRLFGWPSMAVLLGDDRHTGKTTLLELGASVFGAAQGRNEPGLLCTGFATPRALVQQADALSDLPHLVDNLLMSRGSRRADIGRALVELFPGGDQPERPSQLRRGSLSPLPVGCLVAAGAFERADLARHPALEGAVWLEGPYRRGPLDLGHMRHRLREHHGHLGRALCEALVALGESERQALAGRRAAHLGTLPLPRRASAAERRRAGQVATALAAIDVVAKLVPELCPEPALWQRAVRAACSVAEKAPACRPPLQRILDDESAPADLRRAFFLLSTASSGTYDAEKARARFEALVAEHDRRRAEASGARVPDGSASPPKP